MQATTPHLAISASAGTGKTFQLAHRYIRLLACDVAPDRIVSLTFSRKAAGEIFESIVTLLCRAAASPEQAAATGDRIGRPGLAPATFLQMLRQMLSTLNRLQISTLDSFTVRVVKTFPMELGIDSRITVVDNNGAEAGNARRQVLARIFNHRLVSDREQKIFINAFRQATFGQEEKNLSRVLEACLADFQEIFQLHPQPELWGHEAAIWSNGSPWLEPAGDHASAAAGLAAILEAELTGDPLERWLSFIDAAVTFEPGAPYAPALKYMLPKLTAVIDGLRRGDAAVKIGRQLVRLTPDGCRLALALVHYVVQTEFTAALERTRGLHSLLAAYETLYENQVRRRGLLTFNDVQRLLGPANPYSRSSIPSREPGADRLFIDYRLDAQLDHWLLDEFQDTSDIQWQAIANLIDEVLQDDSGRRSFFYVGDIKQAIYGWRAGNASLFSQVLEQYGEVIAEQPLDTSYRSCQPVIETVNRVFGALPEQLPAATTREWQRSWRTHTCAAGFVPVSGYAAILEPPSQGGSHKPAAEERYRLLADLLDEIQPCRRGLSAAVLVRKNRQGRDIVNFLRNACPDIDIVHEGTADIRDNPVVNLLLALVQYAAHPGDTIARHHLRMSPLAAIITGQTGFERLPFELLRFIQSHGFRAFFQLWGSRLAAGPDGLDAFGRKRLAELVRAATEFDGSGAAPDCNNFLRFIENYTIRDEAAKNTVRVMTIHQAKGLGFDCVFLPDLQDGSIDGGDSPDIALLQTGAVLKMPRKDFARLDPVLDSLLRENDEAACFEALCLLYVALTRAKQGLYIITSFPGKSSQALTSAALIKLQLAGDSRAVDGRDDSANGRPLTCLYEIGNRKWYADRTQAAIPTPGIPAAALHVMPSSRRPLRRISPSKTEPPIRNAGSLFTEDNRQGADFGTAIHHLFEQVAWLDECDQEVTMANWLHAAPFPESLKREAAAQFATAVAVPEFRAALSRPSGNATLWREKAFDLILNGKWVSGVFDRVTIQEDSEARPQRAIILDYKSNRVGDEEALQQTTAAYRPQILLYRQALAAILHLPMENITGLLLFTRPGRVIEVAE